jgi:hypothetical protein
VNALIAQRQLALAGIALLAGIVAFALSKPSEASAPELPASIPAPDGGWFQALAAAHGPAFAHVHRDRACGRPVGPESLGVANPVLPCDTKIYISYSDRQALTQVIARGPSSAQVEFELTPALARRMGMSGTQPIGWRYAR